MGEAKRNAARKAAMEPQYAAEIKDSTEMVIGALGAAYERAAGHNDTTHLVHFLTTISASVGFNIMRNMTGNEDDLRKFGVQMVRAFGQGVAFEMQQRFGQEGLVEKVAEAGAGDEEGGSQ